MADGRTGRPKVRFNRRQAQIKFAQAIVKACDGMIGRQFASEADRQWVFSVKERFEAIVRKMQSGG